ncbi:hypothetical protein [Streptomyces sp. NPDC002088]|uniref:zinc finger domain-containing protein n=1 Tax=Streptomyces sp. NPDC002088 TaxID=3154665 RepID=UPI00331DC9B3
MNRDQIPQLLKQVSYADPRLLPSDPKEVMALAALWATVLADVPADFAMNAVGEHYATSPFPIKPSDIADRWNTKVRDRLHRDNGTFEPNDFPDLDPDDVIGYLAALRGQRTAVAQGYQPPNTVKAITAGAAADEVTARLKTLGTYVPRQVDELLDAHRPIKAARRAALTAGEPDALSVPCDWCQADIGEPCRSRRIDPKGGATSNRRRATPHPSRIDEAQTAMREQQEEATTA